MMSITLSHQDYEAVLFDLDGVLTKTAKVHAAAWKRLFDEFLGQRAIDTSGAFLAFDADTDYRRYVDGKPRYDGVASFLQSRGIALPPGTPEDVCERLNSRRLTWGLSRLLSGWFLHMTKLSRGLVRPRSDSTCRLSLQESRDRFCQNPLA
jgi:beta-phosphoglucomutase-like phosphatase (HAD superfamily)